MNFWLTTAWLAEALPVANPANVMAENDTMAMRSMVVSSCCLHAKISAKNNLWQARDIEVERPGRDVKRQEIRMAKVVYKIVRHENGWAYKARGTYSETFPTHEAALAAAKIAAGEQKVPGETVGIEYETADGIWHEELNPGSDRPETSVEDDQ
jgi:hypothetical protein